MSSNGIRNAVAVVAGMVGQGPGSLRVVNAPVKYRMEQRPIDLSKTIFEVHHYCIGSEKSVKEYRPVKGPGSKIFFGVWIRNGAQTPQLLLPAQSIEGAFAVFDATFEAELKRLKQVEEQEQARLDKEKRDAPSQQQQPSIVAREHPAPDERKEQTPEGPKVGDSV